MTRFAKTIIFLGFIFLAIIGGAIIFAIPIIYEPESNPLALSPPPTPIPTPQKEEKKEEPQKEENPQPIPEEIIHPVAFTSQAPFGAWGNPRFQDACEEASILMAHLWLTDKKDIIQKESERELLALSAAAEKMFGFFEDSSASDTLKLFMDYFKHENAGVESDVSIESIKKELAAGNLVLVPANGQKLKNSYYTAPGPERHFLVVRGYDEKTGEFITNDPGTKRGEGYRYKYDVLLNAIIDYPTGKVEPIKSPRKAMIVVRKK